jgi:hypothetical protein
MFYFSLNFQNLSNEFEIFIHSFSHKYLISPKCNGIIVTPLAFLPSPFPLCFPPFLITRASDFVILYGETFFFFYNSRPLKKIVYLYLCIRIYI